PFRWGGEIPLISRVVRVGRDIAGRTSCRGSRRSLFHGTYPRSDRICLFTRVLTGTPQVHGSLHGLLLIDLFKFLGIFANSSCLSGLLTKSRVIHKVPLVSEGVDLTFAGVCQQTG